MKTILVLTGGSDSDAPVFETALAAAQPFAAHLQFVHIRIGSGQAAIYAPHVEFARGPALVDALARLETDADRRSAAFGDHVRAFCTRFDIALQDGPVNDAVANGVTASMLEEADDAARRIIGHARQHDLIVMGRAKRPNGLPPDFIEMLLLKSGRPILLAAPQAPRNLVGTIMVCWRETPEAARALNAAMPFLTRATRVVFVGVAEKGTHTLKHVEALNDAAAQFRRCGVPTYVRAVPSDGRPIADVLASAADDCGADLVVMGAYGHSRMREVIFGGCTQSVIGHAERPVLLLH